MSDDNLDFDAWLAGASITTTSVEIWQDGSLKSRYEDWQRRYGLAKRLDDLGEATLGETSPLAALEAEGEKLLEDIEQSRTVWHLRGLTADDGRAIVAAFPDAEVPDGLAFTEQPPRAATAPTEAQAKAFSQGYEAWLKRQEQWVDDHRADLEAYGEAVRQVTLHRGAEEIVRALVSIEQHGQVVADRVTAEQILRLPAMIGEPQVKVITDAIRRASTEIPEVPVGPLSHGSGSDPE